MILEKETFEKLGKNFDDASKKAKIVCKCDYCGCIFERLKHNIITRSKNNKKDACTNKACAHQKRTETNLMLFGTENAFQNKEIQAKIKDKLKNLYGVENVMQHSEFKKRQEESCEKSTGKRNPFSSKEIQEKIAQKNLIKYGKKNPTQNKEIKKKQEDTNEEIYGVRHALQAPEFRQKAMETCIANFGKFPANNYGKTQKDIEDWLNSFGFNFKSDRTLIQGFEIDIYDPNKKLAIEYCGLHWHHEFSSESRNNLKYHVNKFKSCLKQGVQLLTIFSDEWLNRQDQCKGHIKSILGVNDNRLFARNCQVSEVDKEVGRTFFEKYHIQGKNTLGVIFFGLFFQNELIGAISLGRHNRQFNDLVLDRLCFKDGVQIVGGASKLFSRCIAFAKEKGYNEIISFSDNRWSIGKVYEALDFEMAKEYSPDYSYVDIKSPNKRISKQSQKKTNTNCPKGLTEYDWAHQRGLARIWDCGKKRWIYKI